MNRRTFYSAIAGFFAGLIGYKAEGKLQAAAAGRLPRMVVTNVIGASDCRLTIHALPQRRIAQPKLDAFLLTLPEAERRRIEGYRLVRERVAALHEEIFRIEAESRMKFKDVDSPYEVWSDLDFFAGPDGLPARAEATIRVGIKTGTPEFEKFVRVS